MRISGLIGLSLATAWGVSAQELAPVIYHVSFPNAVHHEAEIAVTFGDLEAAPLTVRMSRSSPGRYAVHEFAKNVYAVTATDAEGRTLTVSQTDPYTWQIAGHTGTVKLGYTLFGDRADGTYSQIDATHAHLNAPATWMWAPGLEGRTVEVSFDVPDESWRAATQLFPAGEALNFSAPDFAYFMDSPVELSNLDMRSWQIGEPGEHQTIRLAVHHAGTPDDVTQLVEKTRKVIAEQIKVFGEAPRFDGGIYTFIADYLPHASGDGMEHRNSTIVSRSTGLYAADFSQLGTISHEFFHAWNVERLRPADLEPFDFTQTNPSQNLWFAEGFTSYYGPLTIRRTGEMSEAEYVGSLGRTLSFILNAQGREIRGPRDMSLRAPFVDAATSIDPTNNSNTFVSYYPYGAIIGLALDLTLRSKFEDVTLDDYMRHLWQTNGKPEKPYTNDDLRNALAAVTRDPAFADQFFAEHVETGALPDYTPLLAQAGLVLEAANPGAVWIGNAELEASGDAVTLSTGTRRGSPLYLAGIERGDQITQLGRQEIKSADDIEQMLSRYEPGDMLKVAFIQRGIAREAMVTLVEDPGLKITMDDDASDAQVQFRKAWLGAE